MSAKRTHVPRPLIALWSEKSAINQNLYEGSCQTQTTPPFVHKSHSLLPAGSPQVPLKAIGGCALSLQIRDQGFQHPLRVVPGLDPPLFGEAGILVRLGVQVDTVNQILWSQAKLDPHLGTIGQEPLKSEQTIPWACQVASEFDLTLPARASGVPIRPMVLPGQRIPGLQEFFQPSPTFLGFHLSVCGTPLLELDNRSTCLLVQNHTHSPAAMMKSQPLGLVIDSCFPGLGLVKEDPDHFTLPNILSLFLILRVIAVIRQGMTCQEVIRSTTLSEKGGMMVCAIATQSDSSTPTGDVADPLPEGPYPGFEAEIEQYEIPFTTCESIQEMQTPTTLIYHDDTLSLHRIPNLNLCTNTKDIHWVCPSKPFIGNTTDYLRVLRADTPEQKCQGSMSLKDGDTETRGEVVGNRWLGSTPVAEALTTYDRHETPTRLATPNQTVFLNVPQGVTVPLDNVTLRPPLLFEETRAVTFNIMSTGITTTPFRHVIGQFSSYLGRPLHIAALVLLLSGWILTAGITWVMYTHIQKMQAQRFFVLLPSRWIRTAGIAWDVYIHIQKLLAQVFLVLLSGWIRTAGIAWDVYTRIQKLQAQRSKVTYHAPRAKQPP